jgi:hypothetical protein
MSDIVLKSTEATRGGFQAVLEVAGVLKSIERVDPPAGSTGFDGKGASDQAKVTLEDAEIIEMEVGEPEPDLKDHRYVFYMNYAKKGHDKPHQNTFFVQGFLKSGEALDAKRRNVNVSDGSLANLFNTRVNLRKVKKDDKKVLLFRQPTEKGSDQKTDVYGEGYVFKEDDTAGGATSVADYARTLCIGKSLSALKRTFLLDAKIKQFPEYKEAADNGTIVELLHLTLDEDGVVIK